MKINRFKNMANMWIARELLSPPLQHLRPKSYSFAADMWKDAPTITLY